MKIFFDCEFTNLENPKLISAGFVRESGDELYCELTDTWRESECSLFVVDEVLPRLQGGEVCMSGNEFALHLKDWIEALGQPCEVVCDSSFDCPRIAGLFDKYGWPKNLQADAIVLNPVEQSDEYQDAYNNYQDEHLLDQHHALVDARGIREAWPSSQGQC